jgi:hypothetical protein
MKKIIASLTVVSLMLVGCNANINPVAVITDDLIAVSQAIDNAWGNLSAEAAPAACLVGQSVAHFATIEEKVGALAGINPAVLSAAIGEISTISNGPLCLALIAGQNIIDPLGLIAQIGSDIAAVEAATNGIVTAVNSVAPSNKIMEKFNHRNHLKLTRVLQHRQQ